MWIVDQALVLALVAAAALWQRSTPAGLQGGLLLVSGAAGLIGVWQGLGWLRAPQRGWVALEMGLLALYLLSGWAGVALLAGAAALAACDPPRARAQRALLTLVEWLVLLGLSASLVRDLQTANHLPHVRLLVALPLVWETAASSRARGLGPSARRLLTALALATPVWDLIQCPLLAPVAAAAILPRQLEAWSAAALRAPTSRPQAALVSSTLAGVVALILWLDPGPLALGFDQGLQVVVGLGTLGLAGTSWRTTARWPASAALTAIGVCLTIPAVLVNLPGPWIATPLAALAVGWLRAGRNPELAARAGRACARLLGGGPRRQRWALIALPSLLAVPSVLATLDGWWDCSPWMDSQGYDEAGYLIATGDRTAGTGFYMPVFQYYLGAVYWLGGHRFWLQQLLAVGLTVVTRTALMLAVWRLFASVRALALAAVCLGFAEQLHAALPVPQIENLYLPESALVLLAWVSYWRRPDWRGVVLLGLLMGLTLSTRSQGAFYFAGLFLTPLAAPGAAPLPDRRRLTHSALLIVIVGATLIPWSVRNYVHEGRFSPSSSQPAYLLSIINDPRVAMYGLRYEIGFAEVEREYLERYPEASERVRAMARDAPRKAFGDPLRLAKAVLWRSLAFYSLAPPGVWDSAGPRPTRWGEEWREWARLAGPYLLFLIPALCGLWAQPGRTTAFLLLGVLGQMAIVFFSGFGEPRVSHPALGLLLLLGVASIAPLPTPGQTPGPAAWVARRWVWLAGALSLALCLALLVWLTLGRAGLQQPLPVRQLRLPLEAAEPDPEPGGAPLLERSLLEWLRRPETGPRPGAGVHLRCRLTRYRWPPVRLRGSGVVRDLPSQYWLVGRPGDRSSVDFAETRYRVVVSFDGAEVDRELLENEWVLVEGTLTAIDLQPNSVALWIKARRVRHLER